jgi:hypothetical protein
MVFNGLLELVLICDLGKVCTRVCNPFIKGDPLAPKILPELNEVTSVYRLDIYWHGSREDGG